MRKPFYDGSMEKGDKIYIETKSWLLYDNVFQQFTLTVRYSYS